MNKMNLQEMLKQIPTKKIIGQTRDILATGVTADSRQVKAGFVFVAISGIEQDGHHYISQAIGQGAVAVVVTQDSIQADVPVIVVEEGRRALAQLADSFYKSPSSRMRVVGITGTNGKTTTTYLVESILKAEGRSVGVIGTVNCRYGNHVIASTHTTPDAVDLQKILCEMDKHSVRDVVMEVSSHALSMDRVYGVDFDVVAFTNLTQDHLDYHQSIQNYFEAKKKLFTEVVSLGKKKKSAVIHVNGESDKWGKELVHASKARTLSVGVNSGDIFCEQWTLNAQGIRALIKHEEKTFEITSPLLGQYNLENILVATGIACCLEISPEIIAQALKTAPQVPGRLERIENEKGIHIFVDYAHTPDALRRVGEQLKSLAQGKVITVFGCGGDRDKSKRSLMAEEAASFSDIVIVTSDNPRTENPEVILDDVMAGFEKVSFPQEKIYRLSSRREALKKAVLLAQRDDMLLVAGKGHEEYQIIGKEKFHFSDQEVLREILKDAA